ncbi:hypothetical protein [Streptacidiphilus sp. EB103A]|uniref:hypothetical protein n=1 Tax=Streptacidiphilus sp. EB103A TaxID=3156275 RepID=UPI0035153481
MTETAAPLTTDHLTDKATMADLLDQMTVEQLHDLMDWCETRANASIRATILAELPRLLSEEGAALFRDGATDTESPALAVEFVTDPNYDDAVYWADTVYFHHADGTVTDVEFNGTKIGDLLTDYSALDFPVHGSHLFIDLVTGTFSDTYVLPK